MKNSGSPVAAVMITFVIVSLAACVQYPTERQGVVDLRPHISFRIDSANPSLAEARVLIDGLDSGSVGEFVDGRASLRVLPGSHVIRVVSGGQVLLDERAYLGDGVSRPFIVK